MSDARLHVMTAHQPGAIAIVQLAGRDAQAVLATLLHDPPASWPLGRLRLVRFGDIDEGLAGRIDDAVFQLMPHGGLRVVSRLIEQLTHAGAEIDDRPPPRELYPEAADELEADMLAAMAAARSPAALMLLARQPKLWRPPPEVSPEISLQILQRAAVLDRLCVPPTVVVVGRPNVGKSTLLNTLSGKAASLVADLPGTTRDWVGGMVELDFNFADQPEATTSLAVRWLDTPGLRRSDDRVEQRAIELARSVIAAADVVVAMRDPDTDWPTPDELPRQPDVRVINKIPLAGSPGDESHALRIEARSGAGVDALQHAVVAALGLGQVRLDEPWAFCPRLKSLCQTIAI